MMIIGIVAWVLLMPAALLVRRPPAAGRRRRPQAGRRRRRGRATAAQALRTPQFAVLARHLLPVLRRAFRADLPHGELCHRLRHPGDGGRHHLQRRGLAGLGGRLLLGVLADRLGVKLVLVAGLSCRRWSSAPISFVNAARRVLRARRGLRHRLWRRHAALCGAGARIFRPARDGHRVRRRRRWPPASAWRWGRWPAAGCSTPSHVYDWLFLGSCAIGLAAVAVALTFPSTKRPSQPSLDLGRATA